jgi:hypothetical protein
MLPRTKLARRSLLETPQLASEGMLHIDMQTLLQGESQLQVHTRLEISEVKVGSAWKQA